MATNSRGDFPFQSAWYLQRRRRRGVTLPAKPLIIAGENSIVDEIFAEYFFPGPEATLSQAIADFTLSADADLLIQATLAQSIGNFTLSADATSGGEITGDLSQSIGGFVFASDADLLVSATLSGSIGSFTLSAEADLFIEADAGLGGIGNFTLSATGTLLIQGSLTQSLGIFTLAADADLIIQASLTKSIGDFTLAAESDLLIAGALSGNIGNFAFSADADVLIEVDAGPGVIGDFTLSSTSQIFLQASLAQIFGEFTLSSYLPVNQDEPPVSDGHWRPIKYVGGKKKPVEAEEQPLEVTENELNQWLESLRAPILRQEQIAAAIEALKAKVMGEVVQAELQGLVEQAMYAMELDEAESDELLLMA